LKLDGVERGDWDRLGPRSMRLAGNIGGIYCELRKGYDFQAAVAWQLRQPCDARRPFRPSPDSVPPELTK